MSSDQVIELENKIVETPMSWLVWFLGCLFYFYEFLLQVSPSVMGPELTKAFGVEAQGLGLLGGVYFYSYSGMQVPAGLLLDRYGPHRLITFATLVCALSTLAFAHIDSFTAALIARFCIGFGSAFAVVGTMKFAANWFPPQRFALLTGIMVAIGMCGAIGGEQPLAQFIDAVGWRTSLNYLGFSGLVLAGLIWLIGHDSPEAMRKTSATPEQASNTILDGLIDIGKSLKIVTKNKQLWLVAIYGGLVFMSTPVFTGLWGVPYLMAKYGIAREEAAIITSMVFVGWIVGGPVWGLLSDKWNRRKPPMIIGTIGALIWFCIFLYMNTHSSLMLKFLMFMFGLFSSGFLPAFSIAKEISCQENTATALSFMNMMNMIGVAAGQPLVGYILDWCWSRHQTMNLITETARVYSSHDYTVAISILPIGLAFALVLLPFIKETHCQTLAHPTSD